MYPDLRELSSPQHLGCLDALGTLTFSDDRGIGVRIVKRAREEPIRQIAMNAHSWNSSHALP